MGKKVNLLTLNWMVKEGLSKEYLNIDNPNLRELSTLSSLIKEMEQHSSEMNAFNDYIYDYSIPQISKQFDILKITEEIIINIELKERSSDDEIIKQLKQNQYYLQSTGKKVGSFTYVKSLNELFQYISGKDELKKVEISDFVKWIEQQKNGYKVNINLDDLFTPSQYLISVFNNTEKFLNNEYFLNDIQQRFRAEFQMSDKLFKAIKGEAGTGKTLLLYDIAKEYVDRGEPILIIHGAKLNVGHSNLISSGWNIHGVKRCLDALNKKYKSIFIDEGQRLTNYQFNYIVDFARKNDIEVYFSYDPAQYLHISEKTTDIANAILSLDQEVINRVLTNKIRSNKEINLFIKKIFDSNHNHTSNINFRDYIEILYFDDMSTANYYMEELIDHSKGEATILGYTEDLYTRREYQKFNPFQAELNAHQAIGQEFNHVVLTLGNFLQYDSDGELHAVCSSYYDVERMFYQLATRTKEKLTLIIVGNRILAERAVKVLNQ